METERILHQLGQALADKKASNLLALDVRETSSLTDFFLIGEGAVARHVKSLAQVVKDEADRCGQPIHFIEGLEDGEWVVIDAWDIVVHLFVPELRQKYQLERVWEAGTIVDLRLDALKDSFPPATRSQEERSSH